MFADLARAYLAQALKAKGDSIRAVEVAKTPSSYSSFGGGTVIRLDTDYNAIMREVAATNQVEIVDGAAVVEQQPSDFIDYCHFNARAHERLGKMLAEKIAAMLRL
jgi:lysophospholipase L1-like esterase